MDYLVMPLADFFQWTFLGMEALGNLPNWTFITIGMIGLFYWLRLQGKFNKEAAANGTLK